MKLVNCPYCKAVVVEDVIYCQSCGRSVVDDLPPRSKWTLLDVVELSILGTMIVAGAIIIIWKWR